LTCEDAVQIALGESYLIHTFNNSRLMTRFDYLYYQAMFKPRFDFELLAPLWNESLQTIYQPNGLPVYNSTGFFELGGNLAFTYVLPTGGDFSLSIYSSFRKEYTRLKNQGTLENNFLYSRSAISFSQPIFTKNTLKENLYKSKLEFEKSTYQYSRRRLDIIYEVTKKFYDLYRAQRVVEINEERLLNSQEAFRIAKLLFESGRIPEGDLMTSELETDQDEAELSTAKGDLEREADSFKQLIGLALDVEILIVSEIKKQQVIIDSEIALNEAFLNRFELKEIHKEIKLREIEVDQAKREKELKGAVSLYYDLTGISTTGTGNIQDHFESSIKNMRERPPNRGAAITISYPIADWGRRNARVQKANIGLQDNILKLAEYKKIIQKEVRDIERTVRESWNRFQIHERNQDLAHRSYEIHLMRFENGDISNQELAIERERLSSIQLNFLNSYIDYELAIAELKRITMWDFKNNCIYNIDWDEE
jgi:outer membrane protein